MKSREALYAEITMLRAENEHLIEKMRHLLQYKVAYEQRVMKVLPQYRNQAKKFRSIRARLKYHLISAFMDQPEVTTGEAVSGFFDRYPQLQHIAASTVERRLRELADKKIEDPPLLINLAPNLGRYALNLNYVEREEPR